METINEESRLKVVDNISKWDGPKGTFSVHWSKVKPPVWASERGIKTQNDALSLFAKKKREGWKLVSITWEAI